MKAAEELLKDYTGENKAELDWKKLYDYNSELGGYVANQQALNIAIEKATSEANKELERIRTQVKNQDQLIELVNNNPPSTYNGFADVFKYYVNTDDETIRSAAKNALVTSWSDSVGADQAKLLGDLLDQMAQEYSVGQYDSIDEYFEERVTNQATKIAEAEKEIDFATRDAAIDWLRGRKYEDIAGGTYTQTEKQNIKTAFDKIIEKAILEGDTTEEVRDTVFKNLWNLLEQGLFEEFNKAFEGIINHYGEDSQLNASQIISNLLFPKGKESELKQKQTALSEVLSKISYEQMSQATQDAIGDPNYIVDNALETAQKMLADIEAAGGKDSKEYKEGLAEIFDFIQSQDKATELINQIRDGQIQSTEEIFSQIVTMNGDLIEGVQDFLEIDKDKKTIKLKKGVSLEEGARKLAEKLGISLDQLMSTEFWEEFIAESIDQQIKDLDANDLNKQILSQLQTLSTAKAGTRVDVSKIPTEIKQKLGIAAKDIYQVTSEFQMQAALMALDESDFKDIESQQWVKQYKQEIENKKPVQQQALQNVIAANFSIDQAKTFMSSLMPNIDISQYDNAQIQGMMKKHYGFDWDPFTQQFITTIESIDKINSIIDDYAANGAAPEDINNLRSLADQLQYSLESGNKYNALSTIIDNYTQVTRDQITALENAFTEVDASKIESLFTQNDEGGNYTTNLEALMALLNSGFSGLFNKTKDTYIKNIQSIFSMATNGTTSITEMDQFKKDFQGAKFNYDEILGTWKLDAATLRPLLQKQAEYLEKNGLLKTEDIESWIDKQIDSMTIDQIDINSILSATSKEDQQKQKNALIDYYKVNAKKFSPQIDIETWAKQKAEEDFKIIRAGGQAAVDKIKELKGDDATAADLEAAYNAHISLLQTTFDLLTEEAVGKFVTEEQAQLLRSTGAIQVDANGMITAVNDLVAAYASLYQQMKSTAQASTSQLNSAYAKMLNAADQKETDAIEALSNGSGMTYDALGELLARNNVRLEDAMVSAAAYGLEKIGGGKVRITDFNRFAQQLGLTQDYNSEEYVSALKSYNDAIIELNNKTEKAIAEELSAIGESKGGDKINLTTLYSQIQDQLWDRLTLDTQSIITNGNVNLSNRPVISAQQMIAAGYTEFLDGFATLYSSNMRFDETGVLYTPITKLGEVLSPEVVNQYIDNLIDTYEGDIDQILAADKADKGLIIHIEDFSEQLQGMTNEFTAQWIDSYMARLGANLSKEQATGRIITGVNNLIGQYGGVLIDGILTLSENANVYGVLQTLADIAESGSLMIAEDLAALKDQIDGVLKSFAESLSKGIKGTLTNAEAVALQKTAKNTFGVDIKLTQGADGLKVALNDAIALHAQLQAINSAAAQIVFDGLKESLEGAGEACENITKTMASIKGLESQLGNVKNDDLQQRLDLYKQIAQAQMMEPEQYKFMDRSLPDYLQGPENYWDSVGKMFTTMKEAGESGHIAINDFYNIVNEMNNLAALNPGSPIKVFGQELNGSLTSAAKLIEAGFGALKNVDGKGVTIDLGTMMTNLGSSFSASAATMGKDVEAGIHEMAQSQIDMLDGMIALLETVVAMEKLGDVAGEDMSIDLGDLFQFEVDPMTGEYTDKLVKIANDRELYTGAYQKFANNILEEAKTNKDLAEALESVKINNYTLKQMFEDVTDGVKDIDMSAELYTAAINSLYQMYLSGDYKLDNLMQSVQQVAAQSGFHGEIQVGDNTIAIGYGVTLTKGKDGYKVDGVSYDDPEQAIQAYKLSKEAETANLTDITLPDGTPGKGLSLQIEGQTGTLDFIATFKDGKFFYEYDGKQFNNQTEIIQFLWNEKLNSEQRAAFEKQAGPDSTGIAQFAATLGADFKAEVIPGNVTVTTDKLEAATQGAVSKAKEAVLKDLASGTFSDDTIELAANVGVQINTHDVSGMSQADYQALLKAFNIKDETVNLTLQTKLAGGDGTTFAKALNGEEVTVKINLDVTPTDVLDKLGELTTTSGEGETTVSEVPNVDVKTGTLNVIEATKAIISALIPTAEEVPNANAGLGLLTLTSPGEVDNSQLVADIEQATEDAAKQASQHPIELPEGTIKVASAGASDTPLFSGMKQEAEEASSALSEIGSAAQEASTGLSTMSEQSIDIDSSAIEACAEAMQALLNAINGVLATKWDSLNTGLSSINVPSNGNSNILNNQVNTTNEIINVSVEGDKQAQEILNGGDITRTVTLVANADGISNVLNNLNKSINVNSVATQTIQQNYVGNAPKIENQNSIIKVEGDTTAFDEKTNAAKKNAESNPPTIKIGGDNSAAISKANEAKSAINGMSGSVKISASDSASSVINSIKESLKAMNGAVYTVTVRANVQTNTGGGGGNSNVVNLPMATGNVALASGTKKTLMGELGPELVVSGGKYFLVGQNGAEMVDLARDNIKVFLNEEFEKKGI